MEKKTSRKTKAKDVKAGQKLQKIPPLRRFSEGDVVIWKDEKGKKRFAKVIWILCGSIDECKTDEHKTEKAFYSKMFAKAIKKRCWIYGIRFWNRGTCVTTGMDLKKASKTERFNYYIGSD